MWQIRRDKYDFYRKNSVPRILNKNEKVEGCDTGDEYFLYDHVPVIFWLLRWGNPPLKPDIKKQKIYFIYAVRKS